jgi:hypothetical protein
MSRLYTIGLALLFAAVSLMAAETFTFKMKDGSTLSGEIGKFSFTKDGVMVKLSSGQFSSKVKWDKLSQETLRKLLDNKDAQAFIEPLLEEPPEVKAQEEEKARKEARTITIKETENKLARPDPPSKFFALFVSPVGIVLFLLIYGANVYAAYEIAIFKNRPAVLVCVLAAVFPVVGSLVFFLLPAVMVKSIEELEAEAAFAAQVEGQEQPVVEEAPPPPPEELPAEPQLPPTIIYQRGQFIFNRRFCESKFAPYFRPTLGDAEKDMVIIIKSARGEFTGHRFAKAEQNEIYLQTYKGAASEEVMIPYIEIMEIQLKHKDAP